MNTNLVIGKINSGKTRNVMFNEVKENINSGNNIVILDNKEEYYQKFKSLLDDNGYTSLVLNLKDSMNSNSFNPLNLAYKYYKEYKMDKAIELINNFGIELFKGEDTNSDPFWFMSAANYFLSLTLILFKEGKEDQINIGSILAIASLGEKVIGNTNVITKYFEKLDVLDPIYIAGSTVVYSPYETRTSIIAVMRQKLNILCSRMQLLNNLCGNEIDLTNVSNKTAIFIIGKNELDGIANTVINQTYMANNFTYILDNFDDISKLTSLEEILDDKKKVYIAIRNKERLEEKYGKYIIDKFENVITNFKESDLNNNYECDYNAKYPVAKENKYTYLNIEELI